MASAAPPPLPGTTQQQQPPPPPPPQQQQQNKSELSPVLQQLNLESIRTRTNDLFKAIASIIQSFQTIPQHKWSEVLGQFSMVNVELVNLVEDVKPILKMFVAHPKNVNADNAPILPIMLSSKLLPEMELEESALKEQILAGVSNLPLQMQIDKLQKQIETIRKACEYAEKVLADNRKLYGLGSRQVPAIIPPLDKAQTAKIAEQEKLLRTAVNVGEGLRLQPNERQQPISLPPHLVTALQPADGGSVLLSSAGVPRGLSPSQPPTIGPLTGASQQVGAAQLLGRPVASGMSMLGGNTMDSASASPLQYANSPRSGSSMISDASPQNPQNLLQRPKASQFPKQQPHLQQSLQHQLRQPVTPPLGQLQGQFPQFQQHAALQHVHQPIQMQQLQSNALQPGQTMQQALGQNQLAQAAGQAKPHLGQMTPNPANTLFGNTSVPNNVMANLGQGIPPQSSMLAQRLPLGMGVGASAQQRTLQAQMMPDSMYNMGLSGSQNAANMGLPLQQHLVGQSNFNSLLNANQNLNFSQQRQQPPS